MALKAFHNAVLEEILQEGVVSSRGRRDMRGGKQKVSGYPIRPRSRPCTCRVDVVKRIRALERTVLGLDAAVEDCRVRQPAFPVGALLDYSVHIPADLCETVSNNRGMGKLTASGHRRNHKELGGGRNGASQEQRATER